MINLEAKISKADIQAAERMLSGIKNGFPKAFSRALNKSAVNSQKDMINIATSEYGYKQKAVRDRTKIVRATWKNLKSSVKSTGGLVGLHEFKGTRQTKKGLSVNVKLSTGRLLIPHGFLKASGKTGIKLARIRKYSTRKGRLVWRYPIETLSGPHPEVVYNTKENWKTLQEKADSNLAKHFSQEIDSVLKGF